MHLKFSIYSEVVEKVENMMRLELYNIKLGIPNKSASSACKTERFS